jgi:uncharacterized protein YdaU (DUF1376 family)
LHFYQFNIGDYRRDTFHLSLLEHGIYRQLLDTYYLNEKPLAVDSAVVMRTHNARTKEEKAAVLAVLENFFLLTDEGWVHRRCEKTISAFHQKSEKARHSAESRWSKRNANAYETQCEGNANQEPITNNQEPITRVEKQRGTRLPANWEPSGEDIAYCKKERTDLQWQRVAENFRDYWLAQAGSKAVKMDWSRVWKTWVRNEKGARTYESAKDAGRRKVAEAILGKVSHDDRIIDIN